LVLDPGPEGTDALPVKRLRKETEHPVQPLPCSQMTEGPLGLAKAFSSKPSSLVDNPTAAADNPQNFKKSRLDTFIKKPPEGAS
jgi:hypothetical protein